MSVAGIMGRIKRMMIDLPPPYGVVILHLLQLSGNRVSEADPQHGGVSSDVRLVACDELFEKLFNRPGILQISRETIRMYLVSMPATDGYSEVCKDPHVRSLLSSAGCIARNARHFRLLSVQAIMYLIRRRGGNHSYTSPFLCLQSPGLFDGCPEGGLPGAMNMQEETPSSSGVGLELLQARRSARNTLRVPQLRQTAESAGPSSQAAADDLTSVDDSSDSGIQRERSVGEAADSDDSDYTGSSAGTASDSFESDDYYVRATNDEPRALKRALRKQATHFRRKARSLTTPNTQQTSKHSHKQKHGRFAVSDYQLPVRVRDDIECFLLAALDTSLDNSVRDAVFKKTLSHPTVERYGKDIKKFLGYLSNILGWQTRDLGLELFADTKLLSDYLEFLQNVRGVSVCELEKQVALAIKVNQYLSYVLTQQRDGNRDVGLFTQDNKHTRAMQRLEAMSKQLRHMAKYRQGASVR